MTYVITRSGKQEYFNENAISARIIELSGNFKGLGKLNVTHQGILDRVCPQISEGMSTSDIDALVARCSADLVMTHPDYMRLAGRIIASNIHKQTPGKFSECMVKLSNEIRKDAIENIQKSVPDVDIKSLNIKYINQKFIDNISLNSDILDSIIDDSRDYIYSFTGYNQLKNLYIKKVKSEIVDRPQYVFLRCACGLWFPRDENNNFIVGKLDTTVIERIKKYYDSMSTGQYIHATPTILNAGFLEQYVSCFLVDTNDVLRDIYDTVADIADISKACGGVGLSASDIRGKNSYILGTNGPANGVIPHLKAVEAVVKAVNQGGKRNGALAAYLSDWHKDVVEFIEMRDRSGGDSDAKCPGIFNALWAHELFFERIEEFYNKKVSGLDGSDVTLPLLDSTIKHDITSMHGQELKEFLLKNEKRLKSVSVQTILSAITNAFANGGTPFICNADAAEFCANTRNYGNIKSSNLCTEIYLPTNNDSYACCVLANIILPNMIRNGSFDFDLLGQTVEMAIHALDRVITINSYPGPECKKNAMDLRPLGLGIQGLSDVFTEFGYSYLSIEAENLDKAIFETMYYHALKASVTLAREQGVYPYYRGSDLSKGIFHWQKFEEYTGMKYNFSRSLDWQSLREEILKYGVRNSTLLALMPTESTSKVMNSSPCIEPWYKHYYANESDINGRVEMINLKVIDKAISLGLWTKENIEKFEHTGTFPFNNHWDDVFNSGYEIDFRDYLYRVHLKQYMIDQGISTNIRHKELNEVVVAQQLITARHYGLKTVNYYVSVPKNDNAKITGSRNKNREDQDQNQKEKEMSYEELKDACSRSNPGACAMCQ